MTNTYAINVTRGQEFSVAKEIEDMGLKPWVPVRLDSRYVKEKRQVVWYERPYVPKLMFCVIPAIYWRDVYQLKHVHGKPMELNRRAIDGAPAYRKRLDGEGRGQGTGELIPAVPGLKQFRLSVEEELKDANRRRQNSEYQCQYAPGQALEILEGPFAGFSATFQKIVKQAHDEYAKLRVEVEIFGRPSSMDIDPDKVA
jgi:transcriptional antiterminator NusG